jgi:hypothetical protein
VAASTKKDKLDLLFDDVVAQYHNGGNPLPAKVKPDDGLTSDRRYKRKIVVGDYSETHLKKIIEAKLDLHHVPYTRWRYQTAQEIVERLFGTDYERGFLHRSGRALAQIAREYPGVQRKISAGRTRYLVP